jgi:ferredoxin-NADP reductase
LPLVITGVRQLTPGIRAYELRSLNNEVLPQISAGSHIQVPVELDSGELAWRNYSISSNPNRTDCYEIAVKREDTGQGGSLAVHQQYQLGSVLHCKAPKNFFPLENSEQHVVLIAGGIGITPIKSMALALLKQQKSFELHYAGRSEESMAYTDRLVRQLGDKLQLYSSQSGVKLSIKNLIANLPEPERGSAQFYFCGPASMLADLIETAHEMGITTDRIHYEKFTTELDKSTQRCSLTLTESKLKVEVDSTQTLLDAVLAADVPVPFSCKTGECKSCVVQVPPSASIQHRDNCLTDNERASGKMCLCVSRPTTDNLIVDI